MIYNVTEALQPNKPLIPLSLNKVAFITLHHTASEDNYTWEQCNIDHKNNGWDCAGYNEMIYPNGDIFILRGDTIGAHTENLNSKSYGIVVVGNYSKKQHMPIPQLNSLIERLVYHKKRFVNLLDIVPHYKLNATECPGKYYPVKELLKQVEKALKKYDSFEEDVSFLQSKGVLNTSTYWLLNCEKGSLIKGEYARELIKNFAKYIKNI